MSPVCEYCGCRQVEPLAELMDEHLAILDDAGEAERLLSHRRYDEAATRLVRLRERLAVHAAREEAGVFTALKDLGEFTDEIDDLTREHRELDGVLRDTDLRADDVTERVRALLAHLREHIDREDNGIFPVTVVTLGAAGWDTVSVAHETMPTFLSGGGAT